MSENESNSSSSSSSSNSDDSDSGSPEITTNISTKDDENLEDAVKTKIRRKKKSSSNNESNQSSSSSNSSSSSTSSDDSENEEEIVQKDCNKKTVAENIDKVPVVEEVNEEEIEASKPKRRKIDEQLKNSKDNIENDKNIEIEQQVVDSTTEKENSNEISKKGPGDSPYDPDEINSPKERSVSPEKVIHNVPSDKDEIPVKEKISNDTSKIDIENIKSTDEKTKTFKEKNSDTQKTKERSRSPHKSRDRKRSRSPRKIRDNEDRRDRDIRSDRNRRKYSRSPDRKRSDRNYESTRHRSRSPRRDDGQHRPHESSRNRREPRKRSKSPENGKSTTKATKEDGEIEENENPDSRITARQRKTVDILTSRTGGAYIPPAKLRMLQNEITDKSSAAYQRIAWEALKKSIHGYINKVNVDNIGIITRELLRENIVRGRGLLCRSIIQAQAASPTFTHVYAALVAIINSKFPNIGELLLKRLVIQFKRAFRRNDKIICLSASRFVAHLVNQRVAHEILALEILTLLVETPTDDSVEVAIAFLKECGMKLTEVSAKGINAIFEMLKNILHEGKLDKRVQYMIEVVFQVRKDGFKDHQAVVEALELVEEDDQYTHLIMLDEATEPQDQLNVFKFDDKYQENEGKYNGLSKELLGSDADESGSGTGSGSEGSDEEEEDEEDEEKKAMIIDNTETNLIALRRTIYLTIHSSLDYEECAHKLMKMQLKPGQEMELCHMFLDCCAEQRTYEKFYGLLAQRFCNINKIYIHPFEEIFKDTYSTTHRLDTNRLRNVSKFFAHLLYTDAIGWEVMECIRLNEDDTTSSSRIFIKILYQELAEYMGLGKLNDRLKDVTLSEAFSGLFPRDNPRNTRFAINFFTSIGLGGLTDELREFLKTAPKSVPAINHEIFDVTDGTSSSASSSSSSSSSSDSSSSESDDKAKKKKKTLNKKKNSNNGKNKKIDKKKKLKNRKNKKKKDSSSSSSSTSSSSSSDSSSDSSSSSSSTSSSSDDGKKSKNKKQKNLKTKKNKKIKTNLPIEKISQNPFRGVDDGGENLERMPPNRRDDRNRKDEREYEWGRNDNYDWNFDRGDRQRNENPFKNNDRDRVNRNDKENLIRDKPKESNRSRDNENYKDYHKPRDNYKDSRNTNNDRDHEDRYRERKGRDFYSGGKGSDKTDENRYRDDVRNKDTSRRHRSHRDEYRSSSKSNRGVSKERG